MSRNKTRGLKDRMQSADEEQRKAIIDQLPYQVGFSKPPRETRFSSSNQPARQGRRRKQPQDPVAMVVKELMAPVEVVEGNHPRKLSKLQVGALQFANRVASGDAKAFLFGLDFLQKNGILDPSSPANLERQRLEFEAGKQQVRDTVRRLLDVAKEKKAAAQMSRE